jgi:hypothetical protein
MTETVTGRITGFEEKATQAGKKYWCVSIDGVDYTTFNGALVRGLEVGKSYSFPVKIGEYNNLVGKPSPGPETTTYNEKPATAPAPVQAAAPATVAGDDARALLAQQERTTKALERCAAALRVIAVAKADTQDVVKFGASMLLLMEAWRDEGRDTVNVAHAQEVLAK